MLEIYNNMELKWILKRLGESGKISITDIDKDKSSYKIPILYMLYEFEKIGLIQSYFIDNGNNRYEGVFIKKN